MAIRGDCGLLAYTPLAFGALTGKYLSGNKPDGSRHILFPQFQRYFKPAGVKATEAYVALAREHGLDPAGMALAFVNSRPFLTANIIGATTEEQLAANLRSEDRVLAAEVVARLEAIPARHPTPDPPLALSPSAIASASSMKNA